MTEQIWETLDSLFKTMHRQNRRVEELEARIADLEGRLSERSDSSRSTALASPRVTDLHVNRAA